MVSASWMFIQQTEKNLDIRTFAYDFEVGIAMHRFFLRITIASGPRLNKDTTRRYKYYGFSVNFRQMLANVKTFVKSYDGKT